MTSSHRNFSGVECCLHTNRLRVFTTRLGGRNNTNSIFSYMTRVILKMLIVLYVYVFIILHLFFCPASNFNTCLLVIIKFFSDLYTRILVYNILQDIYIYKRGNYNIFERSCIHFIFSSVCHIKRVNKYIGIVICMHIL